MSTNFSTPAEIAKAASDAGAVKVKYSIGKLLVLGFLAGAFIALGALFDIRVTAGLPDTWGTLKNLIGGAVFPIGLMFVVIAGAELLTGNMMTIPIALHDKRVTIGQLLYNWLWVTIGNLIGSLFVALVFGVWAHMLTAAPYDKATIAIAVSKADLGFWPTIASAIGCNWLVCLAVWLAYGAKDIIGKIFGIWFPIMGFVAIGFQHVVANMFFLPAGIFVGAPVSWGTTIIEWIGAFIGNAIGGWLFVATAYWFVYLRSESDAVRFNNEAAKG
ncbi:putative transporter YrhG [Alicyclobacillus contaminans]|uniref:formate/nitrite transporter family protein n=1 Tax=Alicyclobacillus contaminans TaxID=392016 RepID=UPI0004022878|nr:formate/nitrite transporter family protein [Alicyclobacillus contaminans]GMA51638.1 putative transporter YrhG [Alicyclobacillus contaminans]